MSRFLSLAALVLLGLASPVAAQPTEASGVAVFRYVAPGRPSIAVDVWGGVRQPGRYLVEPGLSLLDVLALSGGPIPSADDLAARIATVTVTRGDGPARAIAARLTLDDLADGAAVPELADGDLVLIRTTGAGRLAVPVDVWGAVGRPGRYQVEPGATLLDVLSVAGGPAVTTENDRVARSAVVLLSRSGAAGRTVIYEGTLGDLSAAAAPAVEPGDLVTVRLVERQRLGWRDALTVTSGAASLVLVILRIIDATP